MEFTYLNKMKNSEARTVRESEMKFYHLVQVGPVGAGGAGSWLGTPVKLCNCSRVWHLAGPPTCLPMETSHNLCKGPS